MKNKVILDKKITYLPGLNGLRAIAALSVVISHISQKGIADFGLPLGFDLLMAGYGVTLFFVISGFLITYLLLKEQNKTNTISIKKFYVRRILRIWPIYYLYIGICILVLFLLKKSDEIFVPQIWYYIFFTANIPFVVQQGIIILVHYWSIGVEEQFYLLWPWIVRISKNILLKTAFAIFILLFALKLFIWFEFGASSYLYRLIMITRFHCMMIGALGAISYFRHKHIVTRLFANRITQSVSWILFLLMGFGIIRIPPVIGQELVSLLSLSMIMGQIYVEKRIINLENKYFDFIGKISYGVYVIHPLIIILLSRVYKLISIPEFIKYPLVYSTVILSTIFFAWLSYTYFEEPFLKLKSKFTVVPSSNTMLFGKN